MTSIGWKWRATSIIRPRQRKRGRSSIVTAGTKKPSRSPSSSCRKVSSPRSAPTTVGARKDACRSVTSSVYDSSSSTAGTALPGPRASTTSVAPAGVGGEAARQLQHGAPFETADGAVYARAQAFVHRARGGDRETTYRP